MTLIGQIIARQGNTKFTDTKPEIAFKALAKKHQLKVSKPLPIKVKDDEGTEWEFTPDFFWEDSYIYIDGPHHWTAKFRSKDRWQRQLTAKRTKKMCVGIDSPLLEDEQFWPNVMSSMLVAKEQKVPVIQIFA